MKMYCKKCNNDSSMDNFLCKECVNKLLNNRENQIKQLLEIIEEQEKDIYELSEKYKKIYGEL